MRKDLMVTIVNAVVAAVVGYFSFLINQPLSSLALAIIVMAGLYFASKVVLKIDEDKKWWLGNAFSVYIFTWFVVWTLFYNIRLIG